MPASTLPTSLTQVRGVRVGHAATPDGASGVSVVLFDDPAPSVVDVRGGASASFDTASLALDATFGRRWAIFLSGGSLYGLDAARGVRTRILELGKGQQTFGNPNPLVPISGAALFDLPSRLGPIPDYLPLGYEAARVASKQTFTSGRIGAGTGSTVGKYLGREFAMRGGLGTAAASAGSNASVGVLVAVNSVGAVRNPSTGRWIAGARRSQGRIIAPTARIGPDRLRARPGLGTNLVSVVTDVKVDRAVLQRVAVIAQTGLARVVVPANTATDGDVVFVSSTERVRLASAVERPGGIADRLGWLAAQLVGEAVLAAVRAANA